MPGDNCLPAIIHMELPLCPSSEWHSSSWQSLRCLQGSCTTTVSSLIRPAYQSIGTQHPRIWLQDLSLSASQGKPLDQPHPGPQSHAASLTQSHVAPAQPPALGPSARATQSMPQGSYDCAIQSKLCPLHPSLWTILPGPSGTPQCISHSRQRREWTEQSRATYSTPH